MNAPLGPNWPRPPLTRDEARLSDAMLGYWASFVRTGAPRAPGARYTGHDRFSLDIGFSAFSGSGD